MINDIKLVDLYMLKSISRESNGNKQYCVIGHEKDGSTFYFLTGDLNLWKVDINQLKPNNDGEHPNLYDVQIHDSGKTVRLGNCDYQTQELIKSAHEA